MHPCLFAADACEKVTFKALQMPAKICVFTVVFFVCVCYINAWLLDKRNITGQSIFFCHAWITFVNWKSALALELKIYIIWEVPPDPSLPSPKLHAFDTAMLKELSLPFSEILDPPLCIVLYECWSKADHIRSWLNHFPCSLWHFFQYFLQQDMTCLSLHQRNEWTWSKHSDIYRKLQGGIVVIWEQMIWQASVVI